MDYRPPGSSVRGIFWAGAVGWVAISFFGDLPHLGLKPVSPALADAFLPTVPPRKSQKGLTGLKNGWIHDFKWCCQLIPASFCVGFIFSPLALSLNPPRVQWKKEEFSCPSSLSIFLHEAHSVKFESMDSLTRLASSIIYYSYNLISPLQALAFFHLYHNSSGPITSQQIDTEKVETVTNFIFLGSKIIEDRDCSHEIKRKTMPNLAY